MIGQYAYLVVAGVVFGLANVIPGVSGGTMAVVFGFYERLISLIADLRGRLKKDLGFIIPLGIGIAIGIVAFGKVMDWLLTEHAALANAFFTGVIIGSIPMLAVKAFRGRQTWRFTPKNLVPFFITLGLMLAMALAGEGDKSGAIIEANVWVTSAIMLFSGILAAACMIIPGISGSFVMVLVGVYSTIIGAVADLNFALLIPFGIGALLGIIFCAKLIRFLLAKHEVPTFAAILGFVIGSIFAIFPGFAEFFRFGPLVAFAVGAAAILLCNRFGAD